MLSSRNKSIDQSQSSLALISRKEDAKFSSRPELEGFTLEGQANVRTQLAGETIDHGSTQFEQELTTVQMQRRNGNQGT